MDQQCKSYSPKRRLKHHKKFSAKHIRNIYNKINQLFNEKLVEPNSALGKAMNYWLNNKEGLTRFLKVKDVELDNNKSERSLRGIILQRKNSLFFYSRSSAKVLSGLSSIVKTCEANGINAFAYLNWLQDNWRDVQRDASKYVPFAYAKYLRDTELIDRAAA